jgi:ATP adenylyltransferase/5',5'''-P-1,P-4-tetraphosphate phosphorylase II
MSLSVKVDNLFISQLEEWDLARDNYKQLENVRTQNISFGSFGLTVQFNPGRITSSAAKVDARSIEARPCFLCGKNRPEKQQGLKFEETWTLLVNPFPIFPRHLTIVSDSHTDQRILPGFGTMLSLAAELQDFVIFYNGPQCGASAPDHLHFQAGNKGFLPVENDFEKKANCLLNSQKEGLKIWQWKGYLRGIVTFEGSGREDLSMCFQEFYSRFMLLQSDRPEPMLNILCSFSDGRWIIHVIPRKRHRPSQFFAEEDKKIILSPASVDMGGVVITPREEDFNKITASDISDIFSQVCFSDGELLPLINNIV